MYLSYGNFFLKHILANFSDEVGDRVINGALMLIEDEQLEELQRNQTLITPAEEVHINQTTATPTQGIQSSMAVWVSRHSIRGH